MIKPEYPYKDKKGNLHYDKIRQYSTEGFRLLKNGTDEKYDEAVDTYPCKYTYSETTEPIEVETEENNE